MCLFCLPTTRTVADDDNLLQNPGFWYWENNGPAHWGYTKGIGLSRFGADVYGTLYQDVATQPGQRYHLHYELNGNPNIFGLYAIETFWGDTDLGLKTYFPSFFWGDGMIEAVPQPQDFDLIAIDSTTRLLFANPNDGSSPYPTVIWLSLKAVPDGSSTLLLMSGGFGFLLFSRRIRLRQQS